MGGLRAEDGSPRMLNFVTKTKRIGKRVLESPRKRWRDQL
jgi:hypothetical protein